MIKFEGGEPAGEFSAMVNLAMANALKNEGDPDTLALVAAKIAYELYADYGAGDEYDSFTAFALDSELEPEVIDEWQPDQETVH